MKVKILFDKDTKDKKLHTGWGVSFLVDNRILFDTGENGSWLMENIRSLDININKIEAAVISHDHWDHTDGLWELLKKRKGIKVYGCPGFSSGFKDKVTRLKGKLLDLEKFTEVAKNIFVTGEIAGKYNGAYMPEQTLTVRTNRGITVITGCSHPGIVKILEKVKEQFSGEKICLVFGGFHLMDKDKREIEIIAKKLKEIGVESVGPTHCTGYEAKLIFAKLYGHRCIEIKVGEAFEV